MADTRLLSAVTLVVVIMALCLGGGTSQGFLSDIPVQVLALVLLGLVTERAVNRRGGRTSGALARSSLDTPTDWLGLRLALIVVVGLPLVAIAQTAPLPSISGALGPVMTGEHGGPALISLAPSATLAAGVSMALPIALFLAVKDLSLAQRRTLVVAIVAVGTVATGLGYLQVAQGPASPLRFYEFTNPSEAVGFFANRNHFATLLCCLIVFVGLWLAASLERAQQRHASRTHTTVEFAAALSLLLALLAGVALARSRAGLGLALVALVSVAAIVIMTRASRQGADRPAHAGGGAFRLFLILVIGALGFALNLGLQRIMTRFEVDVLDDLRVPLAQSTTELIVATLPFGTGFGTFVDAYGLVERSDALFGGFANRAHNDWLEFVLEGGLPALLLLVVFAIWFVSRVIIWPTDANAARLHGAGLAIIVIVALHSIADYPLRTLAIAALFGVACGLLMPVAEYAKSPRDFTAHRPPRGHRRGRSTSKADRVSDPSQAPGPEPAEATQPPTRRPRPEFRPAASASDNRAWPEAWRKDRDPDV